MRSFINLIRWLVFPAVLLLIEACAPDNKTGSIVYTNPVLHADFSDPDVIRVGEDYYMVASSFNCVPGLPVLHSRDLVSWSIIGYALRRLEPEEYFTVVRHGGGVWAPCIREHNGGFYIYYPDPDHGIFMIRASDPAGPWSTPVMVRSGRGLIDPSPLWDDDGNAYLVYAFAGSRAGVKSVLMVSRMNAEGTAVNDEAVMVFDGHDNHPTVEGPKFYKRNGYYYIFAPAGGVTYGWQIVLRSKYIFGPYEERIVMHQGRTAINGPHQGAWVTTSSGEDWFIHFQDKGAYGRVVHLQPVKWIDDWPVIGSDEDGDGTGEPVGSFTMPEAAELYPKETLQINDEFNGNMMGLQWQWQTNPSLTWGYPSEAYGCFRLNCIAAPDSTPNLWTVPNLFLQKLPAESFTATALMKFNLRHDGEEAGMIIMGQDYQYISVRNEEGKQMLRVVNCRDANRGSGGELIFNAETDAATLWFRIEVGKEAVCRFSYSMDGKEYHIAGNPFYARPGLWIGAKIGFFAIREGFINDAGYMDIDWYRIEKTQ
ncbi:MAG: glycoside hydrolase 43 family protein [Bacteroidales bacterium]|jgi:beta-xylosidase|nr:glycoside hydrolase 43 family protein [Bacteroidales bacterium]